MVHPGKRDRLQTTALAVFSHRCPAAFQAALTVRDVALSAVQDPRAPGSAFLLEDEPAAPVEAAAEGAAEDAGGAASGLLTVRVVAARSLKKMDMVGGADPFVLIKCGELEQKSKIIKKNRNPTWDASFEFPSPGTFATLEVQVYDWDRLGKNDSMGVVKLPVAEMDGVLKWHTLSPTPDCAEPEGEIQLQCSAEFPVERPQNADEDVAPLPGACFDDLAWVSQHRPGAAEESLDVGALCRIPEGYEIPTVAVGVRDSVVSVAPPKPTVTQQKALVGLATQAATASRDMRGVRVRVHIVAARGLKQMDRFGKADPYVTCALGGAAALRAAAEFSKEEAAKFKEGKTAVVKNSLNPRWDEACELVMPTAISTSGDARVELTMFDW